MNKNALLKAIQEMMGAQFNAGFKAGELSAIVESMHPEPATEEPSTDELHDS